jgi:LmbE family N-acetylglucosaminyl deacetylase
MADGKRSGLVLAATLLLTAHPSCAKDDVALLKKLDTPGMRLLVIAPHPDDAALAAGGLIRRAIRRKRPVRVVFITSGDGFPPGVTLETHKAHPQPDDFRAYAHVREGESTRGLGILGVDRQDIEFLGFPDRGLCPILERYRFDRPPYYRSPFTAADRPPSADAIVPGTEYDAPDLDRELRRVIVRFRPTLVVVPDRADEHPDHCASYFLVRDALDSIALRDPSLHPTLVTYVVHFDGWPAGQGPALDPPPGFPARATWIPFRLSSEETARKGKALREYKTQMDAMGGFLLEFVRRNELFALDAGRTDDDARRRCCGG